VLAAGVLALGVCGCDLASLAFFLMPEPREPPEMKKLCVEDGKNVKVPRVVILPCVSFDVAQVEFAGTDGQLAEALARQMMTQCEDSQEKLTVVPWVKVKEYLSRHPNWKVDLSYGRIGEDL